jgi:hypothetical protein
MNSMDWFMVGVILFLAGLLLFQSDDPEPDKPVSCDNHLSTPADMRCACGRAKQNCEGGLPQPPADVRMDKQCKTYCREQHCQCAGHGCRS